MKISDYAAALGEPRGDGGFDVDPNLLAVVVRAAFPSVWILYEAAWSAGFVRVNGFVRPRP